jgi:penicillin-binding protein 2
VTKLLAPRGTIIDRNGIILARNRPSYNIVLYRSNMKGKLESISKFLGLSMDYINERIEKYWNIPISEPVILKEDISFDIVQRIQPLLIDFPNLAIEVEPLRDYPMSDALVHVLGYVGEISEGEIDQDIFPGVTSGELVGKTAIEKMYDEYLRGQNGENTDVVDSTGRKVSNLLRKEPVTGKTLQLTSDYKLQKIIADLMKENEYVGAVVAMNPNSGEVLAMVSMPTYNPNPLVGRFTLDKWKELSSIENDPLQNRTIQNDYEPGSMFKVVMALAGLNEKIITEQTGFTCNGTAYFYRQPFRCNKLSGHGFTTLYDAIRLSCNIYFYNVGDRLRIDRISEYAKRFGFGFKTNIDLVDEKPGLVPSEDWKQKRYKEPWYPGETISVSIGQGALQVTPIQQAVFISALANGGKVLKPFLVKTITDKNSDEVTSFAKQIRGLLGISDEDLAVVKRGMWGVVNDYGTGWGAKVWSKDVAGKTGTSQVVKKDLFKNEKETPWQFRNHSWFSCFAPFEQPEIVLAVLVEHGGDGSVTAAPLAGKILRAYFKLASEREKTANEK